MAFVKQCAVRAAILGMTAERYFSLLNCQNVKAKAEWIAVAPTLVIGETFFYRDALLWQLIEERLLPGLIPSSAELWIWSAGCSTGEEAYTAAAVAVRALGPRRLHVIGTDVNAIAVAAARVGVYGRWSMRGVDERADNGLIPNGAQTVRIAEQVKSLVSFEVHNLSDPSAPLPCAAKAFAMIICRNVLIYMSRNQRVQIISRLSAALQPGGLLVLGHGETAGLTLDGLRVERYDAGIVFRKLGDAPPKPKIRSTTRTVRDTTQRRGLAMRPAAKAPSLARSPTDARGAPQTSARTSREQIATAIAHVRDGNLDLAEQDARRALEADVLDAEPHVVLAALCMARGDLSDAEELLRAALFVDASFVPALWQLGNLYAMTGRKRAASQTLGRALALLAGMPSNREALRLDNLSVGELRALLNAELGENLDA
ncbi:MAG: hypothetical protein M3T49_06930 [Candidatus Eremiobacteraeota bacterium]|nr:hypothetical protein [Candidatus Eremiobacteraeota bacterium]